MTLRRDAAGIAEGTRDDRLRRLGARRGELEVGRELHRVDRLVVGVAVDRHGALLGLQRLADPLQQADSSCAATVALPEANMPALRMRTIGMAWSPSTVTSPWSISGLRKT